MKRLRGHLKNIQLYWSLEDEKMLIKRIMKKDLIYSKVNDQEEIKEKFRMKDKDEESTRKRKLGIRKKMKSRKRRYIQNTSEDDSDKENDELRLYLTIAQDEEKEVDYEILDRKYPIKEWKTECLGAKPQTNQAEHLEEINLNVKILNAELDWIIVSWKLHSSSEIHTLVTDTCVIIHMLVEKKYPLRKEVLMQMLKLKLESEKESIMALKLIKFVKKILAELESEERPQRIRLYCLGKDNGENIMKSITEGPFQMGTVVETLAEGTEGALHLGPERARVFGDLSAEDKERYKADIRATNILLQEQVTNFDDDVDDLALNVDHAFEAVQCDAFDSDVDEGPTTQIMFMANLTSEEARVSYDSNIPSEVQDHEYDSDCEDKYHEVHEMQSMYNTTTLLTLMLTIRLIVILFLIDQDVECTNENMLYKSECLLQ
ncbi:hypothetical protein Tco_1218808 [Tanacetum coccineum]